ncbi:exo-alpha-sialidase, partial [Candidatus Margulisiibacteriota bacterium]
MRNYRWTLLLAVCGMLLGAALGIAAEVRELGGLSTIPLPEDILITNSKALGPAGSKTFLRTNNGDLHIVYYQKFRGNNEIFYIRSEDDGKTWSSPINLSNNSGDSIEPAIVADERNRIYVLWEDDGQVFFTGSADGGLDWDVVYNIGGEIPQAGSITAVSTPTGILYAVWKNKGKLYFRRYDPGTGTWSDLVNLSKPYQEATNPSIALDIDNNLHLAWEDRGRIFYRKYTAGKQQWSSEIYSLSGDYDILRKDLLIPQGEGMKNQFFLVGENRINIMGEVTRVNQKTIFLKMGNTQYTTQADKDGNYVFEDTVLTEGDNSYSVIAQIPGDLLLLSSGFISYKISQSREPVVAAVKDNTVIVAWVDGEKFVYKQYQKGEWRKEIFLVSDKTMNWLGPANIAVDHEGTVFFTWVEDGQVFWRKLLLNEAKLSEKAYMAGLFNREALNPKFLSAANETFNIIKPVSGFEMVWLAKSPTADVYRFRFANNAVYAPRAEAPTNVSVEKVSRRKIRIQWNKYEDQTAYQVLLGQTPDFAAPYYYDSGVIKTTANYHLVQKSLTDKVYYYEVRMANKAMNWGPYSIRDSYIMTDVDVPAPQLIRLDDATNQKEITLQWKMGLVTDRKRSFLPDKFEVICAIDPDFKQVVARSGWAKVDSYTFKGLKEDKYYFKVRGQNSMAGNKKSTWSNVVSTTIDYTLPKVTGIETWLSPEGGLFLIPTFNETRKAYFSSQTLGKTLYVRPEIEDKNVIAVYANHAFRTHPVPGNERNRWTVSYTINSANINNQEVTVVVRDRAGNTTSENIFYIEDNDPPNLLGSWKTNKKGIVSKGDHLYLKGVEGGVTASITGLVNDLGAGLHNIRYRYEQVSENVTLSDGNRWELNPILPDLTKQGILTIFTEDKAGNALQKRYIYKQDNNPPEIEVHSIGHSSDYLYYARNINTLFFGANYHKPETIHVRGYFYDEESGIGRITAFPYRGKAGVVTRYKEDLNKWQVTYVFWPKNSLFHAGPQEPEDIKVRFYDKTGNFTDQRIKVVYDKTIPEPPRAVKAYPQYAAFSGRIRRATLKWEDGTDNQSGIWYHRAGLNADWQKNADRESSENIEVDYGWNTFYVVAIDNVGNVSLPETDTLEVNPVHPRL